MKSKIVNEETTKYVEKAANSFLYDVMKNKRRYQSIHFSTTQYMNPKGNLNQLKFKELVIRTLTKEAKGLAFLNIGTAAGHLELANRLMKKPIHISSVEWEEQYDCCEHYRNMIDVRVDYKCNNILDDDFEIYDIETYFDFVILERFFPLYHTQTAEGIKQILTKFVPYAKRAVVIESDENWHKDQWKYMLQISKKRIKISPTWNCFVVDLEQFNENV